VAPFHLQADGEYRFLEEGGAVLGPLPDSTYERGFVKMRPGDMTPLPADDRNIEKKDKNLDEPVQFYTGKDPVLFEIVVNNIDKNKVSGYLSTPKNAARGASAP